uniref:Uncharacterized protein n=1 Tax=Opuntia streptacantha TaxID=393608 RepID=A0A7C9D4L2_OPUST
MDGYSYFCDSEHEAQHERNGKQHVHLNEEEETEEACIIEETAESIRRLEVQVKSLEQQLRGKRKGRKKGAIGNYSDDSNYYMITSSSSAKMDTSINNPPLEVKAKSFRERNAGYDSVEDEPAFVAKHAQGDGQPSSFSIHNQSHAFWGL